MSALAQGRTVGSRASPFIVETPPGPHPCPHGDCAFIVGNRSPRVQSKEKGGVSLLQEAPNLPDEPCLPSPLGSTPSLCFLPLPFLLMVQERAEA